MVSHAELQRTPDRHRVQFYETDDVLFDRVSEFLSDGLRAHEPLIVIATEDHRRGFTRRLAALGCDVVAAARDGLLTMLDAQETLAKLMVEGSPDPKRFFATVGAVVERTLSRGPHARVRAYGEMVDLLWCAGNTQAALRLEALWNELITHHDLQLMCAYTMASFYRTAAGPGVPAICEHHDHVIATTGGDEQLRQLTAEIAHRKNVERQLRETVAALQRAQEIERMRADRAARLQDATARLATAVQIEDVAEIVIAVTEELLGSVAAVVYVAEATDRFRLAASRGVPGARERLATLALDSPMPLATAIARREPLWIESHEALLAIYPQLATSPVPADRLAATIAMPLIHGSSVVGALAVSFGTARTFPREERDWLQRFAAQCALALQRALLYTAEQHARAEAETLYRITESLNAVQLDLDTILQRVTDEATALAGAELGAFFHNVSDDRGESYQLYTLSGAPK